MAGLCSRGCDLTRGGLLFLAANLQIFMDLAWIVAVTPMHRLNLKGSSNFIPENCLGLPQKLQEMIFYFTNAYYNFFILTPTVLSANTFCTLVKHLQ